MKTINQLNYQTTTPLLLPAPKTFEFNDLLFAPDYVLHFMMTNIYEDLERDFDLQFEKEELMQYYYNSRYYTPVFNVNFGIALLNADPRLVGRCKNLDDNKQFSKLIDTLFAHKHLHSDTKIRDYQLQTVMKVKHLFSKMGKQANSLTKEQAEEIFPYNLRFPDNDAFFDAVCENLESYCVPINVTVFEDITLLEDNLIPHFLHSIAGKQEIVEALYFASEDVRKKILRNLPKKLADSVTRSLEREENCKPLGWELRTQAAQATILSSLEMSKINKENYDMYESFYGSKRPHKNEPETKIVQYRSDYNGIPM